MPTGQVDPAVPAGRMTPTLEEALNAWAAQALPGSSVVAEFVVESVEPGDGGIVIVGATFEPIYACGRRTKCSVRAVVPEANLASLAPILKPGQVVAIRGTLAAKDPMKTASSVMRSSTTATENVTGWSARYACFALNLENGRSPAPEPPPPVAAPPQPTEPVQAVALNPDPPAKETAPAPTSTDKPAPPPSLLPPPDKPATPAPAAPFAGVFDFSGARGVKKVTTTFWGIAADGDRVVYIIDRSGSMTDSIDYLKFELKRSINALAEDKRFDVIFYSSGPPVEMPLASAKPGPAADDALPLATAETKQKTFDFIAAITPMGETDPSAALTRAFELRPDEIYLLTDGEFDKSIVDLVKRLNSTGRTRVHTIAYVFRAGAEALKQIAAANGGRYRYVSEKELPTFLSP